jgi:hypothetical protein
MLFECLKILEQPSASRVVYKDKDLNRDESGYIMNIHDTWLVLQQVYTIIYQITHNTKNNATLVAVLGSVYNSVKRKYGNRLSRADQQSNEKGGSMKMNLYRPYTILKIMLRALSAFTVDVHSIQNTDILNKYFYTLYRHIEEPYRLIYQYMQKVVVSGLLINYPQEQRQLEHYEKIMPVADDSFIQLSSDVFFCGGIQEDNVVMLLDGADYIEFCKHMYMHICVCEDSLRTQI